MNFGGTQSLYGKKRLTFRFKKIFLSSLVDVLIGFRETGEGEKHPCERDTSICCLSYAFQLETQPKT